MAYAHSPVMIIGAGPTGLAAAVLLAQRGIAVRIIDAAAAPSEHSKALAVNPRTLEVLRGTGVDERIVAAGVRIGRACIHRPGHATSVIELDQAMPGAYLIALSQARTEALLSEALAATGVTVERGVKLERLEQHASRVELQLIRTDGSAEHTTAPLVFGADGARSQVRESLRIDFPGSSLPEPWLLWDIALHTSLDPLAAHILLAPDGLVFVMRLQPGLWRVIGNGNEPLRQLPAGSETGEIQWQSSFRIGHRVAARASFGRVALGGDAAHIHSPLGARGMNLGIEDAYVFAACAADALAGNLQRMDDYGTLRHAVHRQVVRRIATLTRIARGRPLPLRWLRDAVMPHIPQIPPARAVMARTACGLDHPLRVEP